MFLKQLPLAELAEQSDENLLEQYKLTGNQRFFAELFRRYVHLIYYMSFNYLDSQEDRRDLVMHVFEKLLQETEQLEKVQSFNNFIHTVARHECINWKRKYGRWEDFRKKQEKSPEKVVENGALKRLCNRRERYLQAMDQLERALLELEERQYQCIRLFFFEKKSYQEIAEKTGYAPHLVKSYLQNGKRRLKHILLKRAGHQYGNFI